jgi:hypothetical protein
MDKSKDNPFHSILDLAAFRDDQKRTTDDEFKYELVGSPNEKDALLYAYKLTLMTRNMILKENAYKSMKSILCCECLEVLPQADFAQAYLFTKDKQPGSHPVCNQCRKKSGRSKCKMSAIMYVNWLSLKNRNDLSVDFEKNTQLDQLLCFTCGQVLPKSSFDYTFNCPNKKKCKDIPICKVCKSRDK